MTEDGTKASEYELSELQQLRAITRASSEVVLGVDENDLIAWTSPSIERILGYSSSELIGSAETSIFEIDELIESGISPSSSPPSEMKRVLVRRRNGSRLWMSLVSTTPSIRTADNIRRLVTLRDVEGEILEATLRSDAQAQYALLARNAADAVLCVSRNGAVLWATPSFEELLGLRTRDIEGREVSTFIYPADRMEALLRWRRALTGVTCDELPIRFSHTNGSVVWLSYQVRPLETSGGMVRSILVILRECHREVILSRALRTMAAASRILLSAQSASDLLQGICDAAVSEGGYTFAWYGSKVEENKRVGKLAMTREHREYLNSMDVTWDDSPSGRGPVGRALRDGSAHIINDISSEKDLAPWYDVALIHGFRSIIAIPVKRGDSTVGVLAIYSSETNSFDQASTTPLIDLANQISIGLERLEIRKNLLEALANQATLVNAIENSSESIMITDEHANIVYANPTLLRTSGFRLDEIVGRNPRIFKSDFQDTVAYQQIWAALRARQNWHGQLVNQSKSGALLYEDVTISPIINDDRLTGYVGVKTDLSFQRQLEGAVAGHIVERTIVDDIMRNVNSGQPLIEGALQFCESLLHLPTFERVQLLVLDSNEAVVPHLLGGTSIRVIGEQAVTLGTPEFIRNLQRGPIVIDASLVGGGLTNAAVFALLTSVHNTELVLIPITNNNQLVGALCINQRRDPVAPLNLPLLHEVSSFASNLLGDQCRVYARGYEKSVYVEEIVLAESFTAHFQPMVDLASDRIVGYEALTRFNDGRSPEQVFSDAAQVGQTLEIEMACARAALRYVSKLGAVEFVSLNFSPSSILSPHLIALVATSPLPVVIEITEHESIADYTEIRTAMERLTNCRLSVDDTGSGFSSLRHIMELNPAFVKIDRTMIRDIHRSHAKQSLVAGICHYANLSDTVVVAEGIETTAELNALRQLGQTLDTGRILGQGFLLGRPAEISA